MKKFFGCILFICLAAVAFKPCLAADDTPIDEYSMDFTGYTVEKLEQEGWIFSSNNDSYKYPQRISDDGLLIYGDTMQYGAKAFLSSEVFVNHYTARVKMRSSYGGNNQYAGFNFNYDPDLGGYQFRVMANENAGLYKIDASGTETLLCAVSSKLNNSALCEYEISYNNGYMCVRDANSGSVIAEYTDSTPIAGKHICLQTRNSAVAFGYITVRQYGYDTQTEVDVSFYAGGAATGVLSANETTAVVSITNNSKQPVTYEIYKKVEKGGVFESCTVSEVETDGGASGTVNLLFEAGERTDGDRAVVCVRKKDGGLCGSGSIVYGTPAAEPTVAASDTTGAFHTGSDINRFCAKGAVVEANQDCLMIMTDKDGGIVAVSDGFIDKGGEFELYFVISEDVPTGNYSMKLYTQQGTVYEKTVSYVNRFTALRAYATVFGAADTDSLQKVLSDEQLMKNIDVSVGVYSLLDDKQPVAELAAELLDKYREDYHGGNMDEEAFADELERLINLQSLLLIPKQSDGKTFMEILSQNAALYEDDKYINLRTSDVYNELYKNWDKNKQTAVCKLFAKRGGQTADSFLTKFEEAVYLGGIKGASYWGDVYNLVNKYTDFFGNAYSVVGTLKNKSAVYTKLMGVEYTSAEAVKADEKEHADEQYRKENKSSAGGGGGGGGGSSYSGSGSAAVKSYTIETGDETVNKDTPAQKNYFDDLAQYAWVEVAVNVLAENGIISGTGYREFSPTENVTREQLVKMLVSAFDLYDENASASFGDVPANDWSSAYIGSAEKCGLVNGVGDGVFGYQSPITREDLVTMCVRFAEHAGVDFDGGAADEKTQFSDDDEISDYAKTAIGKMYNSGLISGVGGGRFAPKDNCTRAEAAKTLYGVYINK